VGAWAAVFDVATPEPAGGGQASAATAAVLTGAARGGARRAVLLSTPAALGLYRRLGFREVETWDYWAPPSRDPRCRLSL